MSGTTIDSGLTADSGLLSSIAHPKVVNLLDIQQNASQAALGVWATRRAQADDAAGNAFLHSLNADGTPNQTQLNINLKNNPTSALSAQDSSQKGQTLDHNTLVTHLARLTSLSGASMALAAQYPNGVPQEAVHREIDQQAARLGLSPAEVQQAKSQFGADPAANTATIFRNFTSNLSAQQQLVATRPGATTIDNGQNVTGAQVGAPLGPNPGAVTPVGPATPTSIQTREQLNAQRQIGTNPDGSARMGTQRQFQNLAAGRGADDDGPASPLGTGRLPDALRNKPAAGATPQPGITVGQGPAQAAAQATTGKESADKFQTITQQGVQARSQDALLATMLSEAQGFRPGPGSDIAMQLKRSIVGLGAQFGTTFGVDLDKLGKQESVIKIGNQLADAQGAGSDARLRVNEGANPSIHNTPAGLDLIIRQLRGNADYLRVREQLAAAHSDKADISGFEAKTAASLDPRVFQYERLRPEQKTDYFKGMTDKDAFIKAHDWAAAQKLFPGVK